MHCVVEGVGCARCLPVAVVVVRPEVEGVVAALWKELTEVILNQVNRVL